MFRADGAVGGYVMSFDNGISIYNTSDTCLFSDMQLIGQMHGPQVAILPVEESLRWAFVRQHVLPAIFVRTSSFPVTTGTRGTARRHR